MHWLIQCNLATDDQRDRLVRAVESLKPLGATWSFITLVPFVGEVRDEPHGPDTGLAHADKKVFALGSTSLILASERYGWKPGVIYNPATFRFEAWCTGWGRDHLLNGDGLVARFGELAFTDYHNVFVRPCEDLKAFSGHVTDTQNLLEWQRRVLAGEVSTRSLQLTADTLVVIAEPKMILREWRFFVVGNRVVSGSQYKVAGMTYAQRHDAISADVPTDVQAFAQRMATRWGPAPHYVIDVAETRDGLTIIEANCLNGSGVYACDMEAVFAAVERYYQTHEAE